MAITVTVTPGAQLASGELLDEDKLNAMATPTVAVAANLSDLTDLTISSPSDNQVLTYDGTTSKWVNEAAAITGFATGDLKISLVASAPTGWVLCNGDAKEIGAVGSTYRALYDVIGTTYNNGTQSAGCFCLPDFRGMRLVGAGGAGVQYFPVAAVATDVSIANDTISVTGNIQAGAQLTVVCATPPAPLVNGDPYYAVIDTAYNSTTNKTVIKLADSLAKALVGTDIVNLTTTGNDPLKFTATRSDRTLGRMYGWETTALAIANLPAHTHAASSGNFIINAAGGNNLAYGTDLAQNLGAATASTGSDTAHNNVTPEYAVNVFIKL